MSEHPPSPILVVDDNPDHQFLAKQTLIREGGYQVETASSGAEALGKIRQKSYALVLLDYNMPGMNGSEALAQILAQEPDLPVVMLTGGGSESVAVELIKAGAYDYLVKHNEYLSALPAVVSRALQRRQLNEKTRELERERTKLTKLSAVVETAITVNHEINNPLFAIKANAQLLQRRCATDDPKIARQIQGILESCDRISQVTRKLANLVEPASRGYAAGSSMLDLSASSVPSEPEPASSMPQEIPLETESDGVTDYLPMLWQINNALSSSLDLDCVLRELAMAMARLLRGASCGIALLDEDALKIRAACFPRPDGSNHVSDDEDIALPLSKFPQIRHSLESGEALVVESLDDPRLNKAGLQILGHYGFVSGIIAPLIHQGQAMGALLLGRTDRSVTRRESVLCQLIAGQVTFAVNNALQHNDLKKRSDQLQALIAGLSAINSTLDLHGRLDALAQAAANLMHADSAVIRLLEGKYLVLGAAAGLRDLKTVRPAQLAKWGIGRIVLNSKEPVVIEDLQEDSRTSVRVGVKQSDAHLRSYMGVRLAARGKTIGIMGIFTPEKHHFTPEEIQTFASLASQASIAIDNARLYRESIAKAQELAEKAEFIRVEHEIVQAVLSSNRIEDICGLLVRNAPRLIPCDAVSLALREPEQDMLRVVASWGVHEGPLQLDTLIPLQDCILSPGLKIDEPVFISDIQQVRRLPGTAKALLQKGYRSCLAMPIALRGRLLGVVRFDSRRVSGFQAEQVPIARELADEAAIAIDNARLYEESTAKAQELAEKAEHIRVKNEIVQAVLASNRIEDICDVLVRNAPRLIPCDVAALTMADVDREIHHLVACWSNGPCSIQPGMDIPFSETNLSDMLINPEPVLVDDVADPSSGVVSWSFKREGLCSHLTLPICFGGRFLGSISFSSRNPRSFHQDQIPVGRELADQAAIAIQNALLLETISISKAEWEATFDAITDPVWVQTQDCTIVKVNYAAAETVEVPIDELIGKRCCLSFQNYPLACEECPVHRTLETGEPAAQEYQIDDDITYLASAYPVLGEGGRLLATVSYVKEITEHKRVQRQLMQSKKLAAVGELAAGVAHNFNNLLTGVRGAIELLQMQAGRESLSPKVTARLQSIKERLDQGDSIVGRLLSFARGSSDQLSELALEKVIYDALGVCETHSDRKGLNLQMEISPELPAVWGIESHLQQVLVNLIINAFQASEKGGTVGVGAAPSSQKGMVDVWVRDNGCGIAEADLPRIFEPFYTKRRGSSVGTGLGLSVSRTMVEAMGGTLHVASKEGEGSTFTISLQSSALNNQRRLA